MSVSTCLWFDGRGKEAAEFYTSLVPNSRITNILPAGNDGPGEPGSALVVFFELDGTGFMGLNGGPQFTFSEVVSIHLLCDSQDEIDGYWSALTADGGRESQCGWLVDKFGLSWQIDSRRLHEMLTASDRDAAERAIQVMYTMKKLDIAQLEAAFAAG